MLQIETWKRVLIWAVIVIGIIFAAPNAFYNKVESYNNAAASGDGNASGWPSFLPHNLVNLGLDLRGGAHLLAEVRVQDVYESRMQALWPEVRDLLRKNRDEIGTIRLQKGDADKLTIRIGKADAMDKAISLVQTLAQPIGSLSAAGQKDLAVSGQGDVLTIQLSDAEKAATDDRTVKQALEIIRRRIDESGTREPTIQRQGKDRILIEVPGMGSAEDLKSLIGTTAQLTFNPVVGRTTDPKASVDPGQEVVPAENEKGVYYILETTPVVSGQELTDAEPTFDQNNSPAVSFRFNPTGARAFGDYTAKNIGSPFAIVLDDKVISAPVIQAHIAGGSGIITGNFTVDQSTNLAVLLRAGALPAGLDFLEERTIGPELGADSIHAGTIACIVAGIAVLVFMVACYGLFGLFANIALICNMVLIFAILSVIGATLTLPGIAGIVLTIGMAVDANVLVFERIREEMKSAKGPARALELGYDRALTAIVDANITTFIIALILYILGTGTVRGFAVTLGIGIVTSVFTAIYVTRLLMVMWFERARPKKIEV